MKKVLFVATVVKQHINEFHLPYIKKFKELGWQVDVAAHNDFSPQSMLVIPGCDNYYDISFTRNPLSWKNIVAYYQLKKIISVERYNLVICNTPVGGAIGRMAGRTMSTCKMVYICHGFHFFQGNKWYKNVLYRSIEHFLARYTDCLLTINSEDYEAARQFSLRNPNNVYQINSIGCDLNRFNLPPCTKNIMRNRLGISTNSFVVITVAELNKNKNQRAGIDAFYKASIPNSVYILCGSGDSEYDLKKRVQSLGLGNRVLFLGYRHDVPELLMMADCFLFTSRREGLSMATVEAMSVGLPVLVSDIRGPRDCMVADKSGYRYHPLDVDGFAAGLRKIYSMDDVQKKAIQDFNISHSKKFGIEHVVADVFNIYRKIGI